MARSTPVEWNLFGVGDWNYTTNSQNVYKFWVDGVERAKPFETMYTIGMRGAGDREESPSYIVYVILIVAEQFL